MWVHCLPLLFTSFSPTRPSLMHISSSVQCSTKGRCFPNPETHQLEPWSMTSENLTARAGAAHNCYAWSLTTCLHFQGCLGELMYALCIKPSAAEFGPVPLRGGHPQRLLWGLQARVHFHYICLHQIFSFIIGSFVLNSIPYHSLVSHICVAWSLMKILLILYVNFLEVQHYLLTKIRFKNGLCIPCEEPNSQPNVWHSFVGFKEGLYCNQAI